MQLLTIASALAACGALVSAGSNPPQFPGPSCSRKDSNSLSCHNTTAIDTCCGEAPGGLVLLTQFWGTGVGAGPKKSWTIHGLWPDFCDGLSPPPRAPRRRCTR